MKIKFIIDKDYDIEVFKNLLRQDHWESRVRNSGISLKLAKQIHEVKEDIDLVPLLKELKTVVNNQYEKCLPFIKKSTKLYEESWNEIIDDFSSIVTDLTIPWFYDEYVCVVTHLCQGVSNWNGNKIGRIWKENPYTQRRTTAHEIILAHYFSIHRNLYKDSGLTNKQKWALAEIAAFALTGLEPKIMKFWPWDTRGYYTNHNYPELVELQNELKEPFLKRKGFQEYIERGINLIKAKKTLKLK